MDQKPLRQEDYLAMEEELRLCKAENLRLMEVATGREAERIRLRNERDRRIIRKVVRYGLIAVGTIVGIFLISSVIAGAVSSCDQATRDRPAAHTNPSPCYFVRQGSRTGEDVQPWDRWYVFKSEAMGMDKDMNARSNSYVYYDHLPRHEPVSAPTRDEAWQFIVKWNLPVCK